MATGDIKGLQEAAGPVYDEVNLKTIFLEITSKAVATDLNTGTNDAKYVTSKGLEDSNYEQIHIGADAPVGNETIWIDSDDPFDKSTTAEIDAGVNNDHYITPKLLEDSTYQKIHIGADAPTGTEELWIDTDEEAITGTPLAGTKVYYVSDSSGGTVNRKLTFVNGILTAET
jgi:hypothetical protein